MHPGTKPKPFLAPAMETAKRVMRPAVTKALRGAKTEADVWNRLDQAVRTTAFAALQTAIRSVPVNTGRLRNSLNIQQRGPLKYTLGTNVSYAIFVEKGTDPHPIVPVRATVLAFFWPKIVKQQKRARNKAILSKFKRSAVRLRRQLGQSRKGRKR
jgi:hypothetical protein